MNIKDRILATSANVKPTPFDVAEIEQYLPTRDELLQEKERTHGDFRMVASTAQNLKSCITQNPNYNKLSAVHRECLDMIATKIARILSGNSKEPDHWLDIHGYAMLGHENCGGE